MSYFIFLKDLDNVENTLYNIAENQTDFNYLNINKDSYKIIEDSQTNFNAVKFGTKNAIKYNINNIIYVDTQVSYFKKESLKNHIDYFKNKIKIFLDNNSNVLLNDRWSSYYNQLNNLNLDNITYPLNKSLEQYFDDLGQPSLNPLQLP